MIRPGPGESQYAGAKFQSLGKPGRYRPSFRRSLEYGRVGAAQAEEHLRVGNFAGLRQQIICGGHNNKLCAVPIPLRGCERVACLFGVVMPKDEWLKARNKNLSAGRNYQDEREQEALQLSALDELINRQEHGKLERPKLRKLRACCNSEKGKGPHVGSCCNFK